MAAQGVENGIVQVYKTGQKVDGYFLKNWPMFNLNGTWAGYDRREFADREFNSWEVEREEIDLLREAEVIQEETIRSWKDDGVNNAETLEDDPSFDMVLGDDSSANVDLETVTVTGFRVGMTKAEASIINPSA